MLLPSAQFNIDVEEMLNQELWASVWDCQESGRHVFLGEVRLPLASMDFLNPEINVYALAERVGPMGGDGGIEFRMHASDGH